jgi:DNA replication protein DnaC
MTCSRNPGHILRPCCPITEVDWAFNPKLPKAEIYELVTGKFIGEAHDALLIGSPGTGKSHIAKTVANAAINLRVQGHLS